MLEGFSSPASPGHARMHIGACLPDSNRRAALVRLLLEGLSSLDDAPAAIGHGLALTAAEFRVLAFVSLVELMATPWLTYARAQDMRTSARRAVLQTLFGEE